MHKGKQTFEKCNYIVWSRYISGHWNGGSVGWVKLSIPCLNRARWVKLCKYIASTWSRGWGGCYFTNFSVRELFLQIDIWQVWWISYISLPKKIYVLSTDSLNTSLLLFLLHTIYLMLIWWIFCRFILAIILCKKVVPPVISIERSHSRRLHKNKPLYIIIKVAVWCCRDEIEELNDRMKHKELQLEAYMRTNRDLEQETK